MYTLHFKESIHVVFVDSKKPVEVRVNTDDEENQLFVSTKKGISSTEDSTAAEPSIVSIVVYVPNEWRIKPNFPNKFIIANPSEGMRTRASIINDTQVSLIEIEPKK